MTNLNESPQENQETTPGTNQTWQPGYLLSGILLIPDPLDNDKAYCRFYFLDLPDLELSDLRDELYALRPLLWGLPKDNWLRQRVEALQAEITRRKYSDSQLPQATPKARPKRLAEGVKL